MLKMNGLTAWNNGDAFVEEDLLADVAVLAFLLNGFPSRKKEHNGFPKPDSIYRTDE